MRPWRSSSVRLTVAGLAALLLAGCVKQDAPGVGIQKLAADIVFGVKPAADTPPPNLDPGPVTGGVRSPRADCALQTGRRHLLS